MLLSFSISDHCMWGWRQRGLVICPFCIYHQVLTASCLFNIFPWMSGRHLKLHVSETKLLTLPGTNLLLSSLSYFNTCQIQPPAVQACCLTVILMPLFLSNSTSSTSSVPSEYVLNPPYLLSAPLPLLLGLEPPSSFAWIIAVASAWIPCSVLALPPRSPQLE